MAKTNDDTPLIISSYAMRLIKNSDPDFSVIRDYPSLVQVRNEFGDKVAVETLRGLIENFNLSVNVVRPMNGVQLNDCAFMLLNDCPSYRIEDFVIMFFMAKTGKLGKIMDRVDIELVSRFVSEYDKLRTAYGERMKEEQYKEKEKFFEEPKNPVTFDPMEAWRKLKQDQIKRREKEISDRNEKHQVKMDDALQVMKNYQENFKPQMKSHFKK